MNCFQIEVRGVTFTIWAPTLREAVETFMIDMDFFEVPKESWYTVLPLMSFRCRTIFPQVFSIIFLTSFVSMIIY